jgi:hypothetical protein
VYSGNPTLTSVVMTENSASSSGGGLYVYSGSPSLTNVTVVGNSAGTDGGGLGGYVSFPTLTNVTMSENTAGSGGAVSAYVGSPTPTYCNVYNNSPDDYDGITDPTGTDGNISADPGFLDKSSSDPLDWDLRLSSSSPLINAGDPSIADPDGSTSDIGAYGGPGGDW